MSDSTYDIPYKPPTPTGAAESADSFRHPAESDFRVTRAATSVSRAGEARAAEPLLAVDPAARWSTAAPRAADAGAADVPVAHARRRPTRRPNRHRREKWWPG